MKHRSLLFTLIFALILTLVPVSALALPDRQLSMTERRPLAQKLTHEDYLASHFGADMTAYLAYLEDYLLDQFPLRDQLRLLTGLARVYGLGQKDNKLYYKLEGHLSKLDPRLQEKAVQNALDLFQRILQDYFEADSRSLFALIPDKNAFMAPLGHYPHYPYEELEKLIEEYQGASWTFKSLVDRLTLDDYYRTDPHWDQTRLLPLAQYLLTTLGRDLDLQYHDFDFSTTYPYLGSLGGQAALPVEKDLLAWLTSDLLEQMTLHDPLTGERGPIYQLDKLQGMDAYDVFLGGAKALLRLENPAGEAGSRLVVFRDSYGSSLTPLLALGYEETLVIDLRYMTMDKASQLVSIDRNADILFLFSSSVLNSPGAFLK